MMYSSQSPNIQVLNLRFSMKPFSYITLRMQRQQQCTASLTAKQEYRIIGIKVDTLNDKHLTTNVKANKNSTHNLYRLSTAKGLKNKYKQNYALSMHRIPRVSIYYRWQTVEDKQDIYQ